MSDTATKVQHTPGPWEAMLGWRDLRGNEGWHILSPTGDTVVEDAHPENARLIAAAPELYELLKLASRYVHAAAIQKGEGWLSTAEAARERLAEIDAVLAKVDGAA